MFRGPYRRRSGLYPTLQVLKLLEQVRDIVLAVATMILSDYQQFQAADFTLKLAGHTWDGAALGRHLSKVQDSRQVGSGEFWEKDVRQILLPVIEEVSAQLVGEVEVQERLIQEACLATLPCGNPLCTNMSGCSEGRLRGRRCGGCRAVRYCSRECQGEAWSAHSLVCKQLEQLGQGVSC